MRLLPNHLKISLGWKITLLCLLIALGSATVIGLGLYSTSKDLLIERELGALGAGTQLRAERGIAMLQGVRNDVKFLSRVPAIQGIIRARAAGGTDPFDGSTERLWRTRLAFIFTELLQAHSQYLQIRYIGVDHDGQELVRVDRAGTSIRTVSPGDLQSKSHTKYFKETVQLNSTEIYLSEINLNRENEEVSFPHMPVLRAATPIFTPEKHIFGMIIVNLNFVPFLHDLAKSTSSKQITLVFNDKGDYLSHPDPERTFGFDRGQAWKIQDDFPILDSMFFQNRQASNFQKVLDDTQVVRFVKIPFDTSNPERFLGLGIVSPVDAVLTGATNLFQKSLIILAIFIPGTFVSAHVFSRRLVRPISLLKEATHHVATEDAQTLLPMEKHDELGSLVHAFQEMTARINKQTEDLRKEVHERKESQERLRALVDSAAEGIVPNRASGESAGGCPARSGGAGSGGAGSGGAGGRDDHQPRRAGADY